MLDFSFSAGLKPGALKLLGPVSTQTTAGLFLQTGFCYGNFCLNKAESQRARTKFLRLLGFQGGSMMSHRKKKLEVINLFSNDHRLISVQLNCFY